MGNPQQFLEYEIFQGSGTWPSVLTAPYTFVNDSLATFYGMAGVTGSQFRKVPWPNLSQRLGLRSVGKGSGCDVDGHRRVLVENRRAGRGTLARGTY